MESKDQNNRRRHHITRRGVTMILIGFTAAIVLIIVALLVINDGDFSFLSSNKVNVIYNEKTGVLTGPEGQTYKMIDVEGGQFTMGSQLGAPGSSANESPQHGVSLSSYKIGATEVPQWLWTAVMSEVNINDYQPACAYFNGDNLPMESVNIEDINIFLERLNKATGESFRLPTEAEWEFAARGGMMAVGDTRYSGGDSLVMVGWVDENSHRRTSNVGELASNRLGIYDMTGNVAEWTADHYGIYHQGFVTDPKGPSGSKKQVVRGGSHESSAQEARLKARTYEQEDNRQSTIGFRLAL